MPIDWTRALARINKVGRVRCEPGWHLAVDWSSRLEDQDLWFIWAGAGRMELGGRRTIALAPGVCVWMRPGGIYRAEQDPRDRLGVTYLHFDLLAREPSPAGSLGRLPSEVHEVAEIGRVDALLRRVAALVRPVRPTEELERGALIAEHLLTSLLIELDASPHESGGMPPPAITGRRARILELAERITEDPASITSIASLAEAAACTPDHLSRLFREVLGRSPQEFVIQARIERARQLLLETSLSIGEIAFGLRYDSPFFFARQFKQRVGCTPSQYRHVGPPVRHRTFGRRP